MLAGIPMYFTTSRVNNIAHFGVEIMFWENGKIKFGRSMLNRDLKSKKILYPLKEFDILLPLSFKLVRTHLDVNELIYHSRNHNPFFFKPNIFLFKPFFFKMARGIGKSADIVENGGSSPVSTSSQRVNLSS